MAHNFRVTDITELFTFQSYFKSLCVGARKLSLWAFVRITLVLLHAFQFQKSSHVFKSYGASMNPLLLLIMLRVTKKYIIPKKSKLK